MKDYVFIGWSRNRDLAIALKNILDQHGFACVIGGVYENNPEKLRIRKGTVNETINFQLNHCDQAIMLFQKLDDNLGISGNLIYELGYINARYGYIDSTTKLHIFKLDITQADDNLFPSDLHGVWGEKISTTDRTDIDVAKEIAERFINNQSQIKKVDKFKLLNNYSAIEIELAKHFDNQTMSDYDLATDILIYVQASFCYQRQNDAKRRLEQFKSLMTERYNISHELELAIDYGITTLNLYCITIPDPDNGQIHMPGSVFRGILREYTETANHLLSNIRELNNLSLHEVRLSNQFIEKNDFEAWMISQMQEHISYLILVYLSNPQIEQKEKEHYAKIGQEFSNAAIKNLALFERIQTDALYSKLLTSYAQKNLSTFLEILGENNECEQASARSLSLRREIYSFVCNNQSIRPTLKDYIALEYFLQVVEKIQTCDNIYEKEDYYIELENYIQVHNRSEKARTLMFSSLIQKYESLKNKSKATNN